MRSRPPALAGGIVRLLVVTSLAALPAGAEERFHLFRETGDPPPPGLRVQLDGLPPSTPLAALQGSPAWRVNPPATAPAADVLPLYPTEKRFAAAALETLALDFVPWALNRYATDFFFAEISVDSTRHNLQTGFTYDHDVFPTNQASHPYHGGLYFNAARTNGYSFWESAPFVLGGSFLWEMFSESQPPALNDLVQTTLGGMAWGETQFRISNLILDNTKSGFERFLREAAGLVVNPMGGFNRLLRGQMWTDFQNPPDRYPGRLYMELDGGYIHSGGALAEWTDRDQGGVSFLMRYGDPFDGDTRRPFDAFEVQIGLRQPAPVLLTQVDIDGILAAWKLSEVPSAEQLFAFYLSANYFANDPRTYGGQAFGARHLLRVALGRETDLRTEASVMAIPLAALGVDYPDLGLASDIGRYYDYGPGLGARASARVRRREVDLLSLAWSLIGTSTSNGLSRGSRLQAFSAEARLPLVSQLLLGGGWSWSERLTTYEAFPTVHLTGTSWRLFAGWSIPEMRGRPERDDGAPEQAPAGSGIAGRWDVSAFAGAFFGTRVYTGVDRNVLM
ncbi:MAG TPA: DUF3943 domain-containing protein, partial [Thermoanaerobaculia bacterium]|nr:DUF3943 domain-containing protein [Thermoanaerobaculia bacterium]